MVLNEQNSVHQSVEHTVIERENARKKNMNKFYTGVKCNNGHLSQRYVSDGKCVQCVSERNSKRYDAEERRERHQRYYSENAHVVKDYQMKNREYILNKKKEYRLKNKEEINRKKRKWNKLNKNHIRKYKERNDVHIREQNQLYYRANKKRISKRVKEYNKKNPLNNFVRSTLRRIERAKGVERIKRAELDVGYTQSEFKKHIETLFKEGMSWNNRSEWHIGHIKPISVFIKEGVTDLKIINALSNLQPLWAKENMEKYNKWQ